jgi:hypothetical protein
MVGYSSFLTASSSLGVSPLTGAPSAKCARDPRAGPSETGVDPHAPRADPLLAAAELR